MKRHVGCGPCAARRKALLEASKKGDVGEALRQAKLGLREMLGQEKKEEINDDKNSPRP